MISINKNILGVEMPVTLTEEDFLKWMILNKGRSVDLLIMPFLEALMIDNRDVAQIKLNEVKELLKE